MARGVALAWPDDDELRALAAECGGVVNQMAARLGRSEPTVRKHLERRGLLEEIKATGLKANPVIAQPKPVDDPELVRITQLETATAVLRRERDQLKKALASQEEFFDRIVEATRIPVDVPKLKPYKPVAGKRPHRSIVAPIFDQQFGQFVRPTDTPGNRGGYSVEVFDQRLQRWVDGVTSIAAKGAEGYNIEEFLIPFGGDHVEGDEIFAGQAWQLELDPCQQVWELALKMDAAIRTVVRFAREEIGAKYVGLYGVDDNHGKVGGKKAGARPATYSWNWLFLKILFDRLRAEPVDEAIIEPGGALFFRCAGHEFQLIHGHQIRGWGGLPFYGLTKFDGRSIRMHNAIYRYLLMGHHHQAAQIPNGAGETIVSADWVGANNLSGMITAASRPSQNLLFVQRKWGIAAQERIYFTEADEQYAKPTVYGQAA